MKLRLAAALLLVVLSFASARGENWPGWRGPRGDGTSLESKVPFRWSAANNQNIVWKTPLPGGGHASPIVWEDRIFIVTCLVEKSAQPRQEHARALLCLDRRDGKLLWQQTVILSPLEAKHGLNSYASSTPATDGKLVYVTFLDRDDMVVAAYDFDGKQQWLVRPGEFHSKHGYCSCPVLYEDLVIVNGDHDGNSYIVALDKQSGRTVWKTPRRNKTRSYVTPIIREIGGRTQMVLSGDKSVTSYDPRTGKLHWYLDGPTEQFVASLVYNGELLFLTAGYPEHHMLAIRPDASGEVSKSQIVWRTQEGCSYVPSPIAAGDYFLVVSDGGIGSCFEAGSGKRVWKERLGPHFSASLVTAGGLVYFTADNGVTKVVKPGPEYDEVAENDLGENVYASPAISNGQIFFRTDQSLICIGGE